MSQLSAAVDCDACAVSASGDEAHISLIENDQGADPLSDDQCLAGLAAPPVMFVRGPVLYAIEKSRPKNVFAVNLDKADIIVRIVPLRLYNQGDWPCSLFLASDAASASDHANSGRSECS
jgi:hypothetical protein